MSELALSHLRTDRLFAALIRRVGQPRLGIQRRRSPYEALVRAIAHQQLHGRFGAATTGNAVVRSAMGSLGGPITQ